MHKLYRTLIVMGLAAALSLGVFVFVVSAEELSPPYIIAMRKWGTYANVTAVDTARQYVYVGGNSGIAVYSGTQYLQTLTTAAPQDIAVDQQRGYAYATMSNLVRVIDATNNFDTEIQNVVKQTGVVDVMTTTGYAYVTLPDDGEVVILNTGIVPFPTVTVGDHPRDVAVNPVTGYIYVANEGSDSVTVFTGTGQGKQDISLEDGAAPYLIKVDTTTGYVYVANSNDKLTILQGTTIEGTLSMASASRIEPHPDTGRVYVATNDTSDLENPKGQLELLQGATHLGTIIPMPRDVRELAVDRHTGYIYVACGAGKHASISVMSDTTILETFPIGTTAMDIGLNPGADLVYAPIYDGRMAIFGRSKVYGTTPLGPTSPDYTLSCLNTTLQGDLPITITIPAGAMSTPDTRLLCIPMHSLEPSGYVWAGQAFRLLASIGPTGTRPLNYTFNHSLQVTATYPSVLPSEISEEGLEFLHYTWYEDVGIWAWNHEGIPSNSQSMANRWFLAALDNVGEHAILWQKRVYLPLVMQQY